MSPTQEVTLYNAFGGQHRETKTLPSPLMPAPITYPARSMTRDDKAADCNLVGQDFEIGRTQSRTTLVMPPPYAPYGHQVVEVEQGVYTVKEPPTLARMLFMYGFLFFPFWLAGIYIFFSPLQPTPDWEAGKTADEKTHLLEILRRTEKKWALRCLYSMIGLIVGVVLLVVIIKYGILADI